MPGTTDFKTLGLRRGTVRLAPHNPDWLKIASKECARLLDALEGFHCAAEHVGSTSIPGLPAKPILDLVVLAPKSASLTTIRSVLTSLGYDYRGNQHDEGGHLFVLEVAENVRAVHLHLLISPDPQWQRYLNFRDQLRKDETLRADYAELKTTLTETHSNDRLSYTQKKASFIKSVLANGAST